MRSIHLSPVSGLFLLATAAMAQGTLDPDFGTNGFAFSTTPDACNAADMTITSDGRILFVGVTSYCMGSGEDDRIAIFRCAPDGSIDPTFGTAGLCTISLPGFNVDELTIDELPDGKYLVLGNRYWLPEPWVPVMFRLTQDGNIDQSFGDNGMVVCPNIAYGNMMGHTIQPDGKLLLGFHDAFLGPVIMRFTQDGELDAAFGDQGIWSMICLRST